MASTAETVTRAPLAAVTDHPYLTGIHTPMREELTLADLDVTGTIPPGLDGRYLRIGPNSIAADPASYHWFVGDGMVHGVRLKDGKALWYRNRWMRSTAVSAALGEAPAAGPRIGLFDTVNTNVLGHAGKTWALVEAGSYPIELGDNLETVAFNDFGGTLAGSFTAHPHLDPATGELHAICYRADDFNVVRHVVVDAAGRVRREEPVAVEGGPSIHDCAITARYVLIFDLPVTFSFERLNAGFAYPYAWNPSHAPRVGLLPREGTGEDVIWCDVDPAYVFHPCNAFDTADGKVVVDVAAHATMFASSTQGPDSTSLAFERWTIDPAARRVTRAVIDAAPQEFPRCDERLTGKPYRYAYSLSARHGDGDSRLFKHDLDAGTREVHDFGPGRVPGEFVFVPKSADAAEDDGWLMGYVIDMRSETTDLAILDAHDFEGPPVARVHIPHRIPPGFHGNWVTA